jgi:hypothetical protein
MILNNLSWKIMRPQLIFGELDFAKFWEKG